MREVTPKVLPLAICVSVNYWEKKKPNKQTKKKNCKSWPVRVDPTLLTALPAGFWRPRQLCP